jgi:endonuclease/exonuclease/phosphatase family metal-dependent hydrolase
MAIKLLLVFLFAVMLGGTFHFKTTRDRSLLATKPAAGPTLRLMTWNIGYGDLEADTRAHTSDLRAIAEIIRNNDPDAVALQELAGPEQLNLLLRLLRNRYRAAVAPLSNSDRVEAVLVKNQEAQFEKVPAGDQYAMAATFRVQNFERPIRIVSAHADAFRAARRRVFTGDVVDWARTHEGSHLVFLAGDFNFEVASRDQSNLYTDNLKNDSEAYSYLLKYFRDFGREAGDTAINDRRIDYIFGPRETVLRRADVLRSVAVGRMDHWPLLIEVAL